MTTTAKNSKAIKGFRTHSIVMIAMLILQYILGMITNLFVKFPENGQPEQLWAAANSQFASLSHIILGMLLLVVGILIIIRAVMSKNRTLVWISVAGLVSILVAIYSGSMFVTAQTETYSLIMAIAYIVSVVAYGWGFIAVKK
jgi:hypothetical protein